MKRASHTIRHLDWFEVKEIRGSIGDGGAVNWYQVKLDVGFKILEAGDLQNA